MVAHTQTPQSPATRSLSPTLLLVSGVLLTVSCILALVLDPRIAILGVLAVSTPFVVGRLLAVPIFAVSVAMTSHAWAFELGYAMLTPFKISVLLATFVVLRRLIASGSARPMPRFFTFGLVAMLLLVAIGELFAEYEGSNGPFLELFGTISIFFILAQSLERPEDLRVVFKIYTVNLFLTFLSVLWEVPWDAMIEVGTRASGICGQPNVLGNHMAMSLPFALVLAADRGESRAWRLLGAVSVLGAAYGEWAAASRGGTLGFMAAVVAFAVLSPRTPTRKLGALVLALACGSVFVSLAPKSFSRVTDTFDGSVDLEQATSERSLHARLGSEMFPKHPFLGSGVTAFGYERSRYTGRLGGALHSAYLAVAVAYGLPTILLYIALQLSAVVATIRMQFGSPYRLHLAGLAAAAVAASTTSASGTELFRAEQWGIFSLCYLSALRELERRRAEGRKPEAAPA